MSRDHLRLDYLPLFIDQNLDADRASQMNLLRHGRIDWLRQADSFRSQHARRHAFGLGLWWNRFGWLFINVHAWRFRVASNANIGSVWQRRRIGVARAQNCARPVRRNL